MNCLYQLQLGVGSAIQLLRNSFKLIIKINLIIEINGSVWQLDSQPDQLAHWLHYHVRLAVHRHALPQLDWRLVDHPRWYPWSLRVISRESRRLRLRQHHGYWKWRLMDQQPHLSGTPHLLIKSQCTTKEQHIKIGNQEHT